MGYSLSFWEKELYERYDLAVIGGGIVGVNAAITYKEKYPDQHVAIIERGTLPTGASTKNAGFTCIGSMTELLADAEENGWEQMLRVLAKRWSGLQALHIQVPEIEMDYHNWGGIEIFLDGEEKIFQACQEKLPAMNANLAPITGHAKTFIVCDEEIERMGLTGVSHMILNRVEGQLHPGKMMHYLHQKARNNGIQLLHGWAVADIQTQSDGTVTLKGSKKEEIHASKAIIATNGFARKLLPDFDVTPVRNQVLITEPIPHLKLKGTFHYHQGYVYFRNVGNRVLIGGGRHLYKKAETTDAFGLTEEVQAYLENFLRSHILKDIPFQVDHRWSGILGVGKAKHPIIEECMPSVYAAVRLGGMGVAIGTLVGQEVVEAIRV
ncbi:MAG: FAD-dependent oxidoreductase [Bacteroidota bacterium]